MTAVLSASFTFLFAYLLGSIPVAYLVGRRVSGVDVRVAGEGNVGARNVFHVVGGRWGVMVFLGDFVKGAAVALAFLSAADWQLAVAGVGVFLGHAFPVWLGFVGGKGLSTVGGFAVVLVPVAALVGAAAAAVAWVLTRKFLPTLVTVTVVALIAAVAMGIDVTHLVLILGMFTLVGLKRALDEPRMRMIEAETGWDRRTGLG